MQRALASNVAVAALLGFALLLRLCACPERTYAACLLACVPPLHPHSLLLILLLPACRFFPHFLWVVRDFSVKLERDGRKISSREYLEDALRPEEGVSEATEAKNAVRMLIRSFFPERDCVTLVRPVMDEKQLMALSSLPGDALRPEFRAQIDAMRRRLATALRPKTLYGKPLNGAFQVPKP